MKFADSEYNNVHKPKHLRLIVRRVLSHLKNKFKNFDAIAVRGISGSAVGYPVSYITGIPVIQVRKLSESYHGIDIESDPDTDILRYVIIDDFVESGDTVQAIVDSIDEWAKNDNVVAPNCVGVILYGATDFSQKHFTYKNIKCPIVYAKRVIR